MTFSLLLKIYSWVFTSYSYIGHECCGLEIRYIMHMHGLKSEAFVKSLNRIIPPSRRKTWATYLPDLLFVCAFLVRGPRTKAPLLITWYLVLRFIIQFLSSFSAILKHLSAELMTNSTCNSCVFNFEKKTSRSHTLSVDIQMSAIPFSSSSVVAHHIHQRETVLCKLKFIKFKFINWFFLSFD